MDNHKLISFVVPVFNKAQYLKRAIKSVISQTYKNIEIIFINDGSTDNSLEILEQAKNNFNNITIINQENKGVNNAICTGIKQATGKYVCFLDADDYIGKNFVENMYVNIKNYDFIAMGYYSISDSGITEINLSSSTTYDNHKLRDACKNFVLDRYSRSFTNNFEIARWNKMYKTSLLKEIVPEYAKYCEVINGEDCIFTFLILNHANNGIVYDRVNEYYYDTRSENSITSEPNYNKYLEDAKNTYKYFSEIFQKYSYNTYQPEAMYYLTLQRYFDSQLLLKNNKLDYYRYKYDLLKDPFYCKAIKYFPKLESSYKIYLLKTIGPFMYYKLSKMIKV